MDINYSVYNELEDIGDAFNKFLGREFEIFQILGMDAMFTSYPVNADFVSRLGLYIYDLAESDGFDEFSAVKDHPHIFRAGMVITAEPITGDTKRGAPLVPNDYSFVGGEITVKEFMETLD